MLAPLRCQYSFYCLRSVALGSILFLWLTTVQTKLPPVTFATAAGTQLSTASAETASRNWEQWTEEVRKRSLEFTDHLPDFICTQVTRRFNDETGQGQWMLEDTVEAALSFHDNKETYSKVRQNGQLILKPFESLGGTVSFGEFGSLLRVLFLRETHARFSRLREDVFQGRKVMVMGFEVDQENSSWVLSFKNTHSLKVAYEGEAWVDENDQVVFRIWQQAKGLPRNFPVAYSRTQIEFDRVSVRGLPGVSFVLPTRADFISRERNSQLTSRNIIQFRDYQKFTSDVLIRPQ